MQTEQAILAIDQGTSSSRAIIFDGRGREIAQVQQEFAQIYPKAGWVEHDPEAIWETSLAVSQQAVEEAEAKGYQVAAIGITNQRETTVVWDRETGKPLYNAIVWQDRRTADFCQKLVDQGVENQVQETTGLLLDPYFSASKVAWILDNVAGARQQAEQGKLAFGTIDSFLIWRLTGGQRHVTDATNASRTSLYNIGFGEGKGQWDTEMLRLFNIPEAMLPEVKDCAADFGLTQPDLFARQLPICGVAGDQQAAAIGQCCFSPGAIKSTYGTGCFVLMNTGEQQLISKNRLLTTIAYRLKGKTSYALEGSIFMAGAAVQWLRDGLGIIQSASETEQLAASLDDNGGVYLVPAFTGLGAPHWDAQARGAIYGLTRGSGAAHLVRATLESVCYQTADLLTAMRGDGEANGVSPQQLKVDGGMVRNNWLLQFLSDVVELPLSRPVVMETTALGVAYLAGLQTGIYGGLDDIEAMWQQDQLFSPKMDATTRDNLLDGWQQALSRTLT